MTAPLRIAFAGTPDFALPVLDALVTAGHRIVGVWTQPDRPAGRGREPSGSPIKMHALALGLPVHQPETLKTSAAEPQIRAAAPDALVVVAYGLLLPPAVLTVPPLGCVNVHASLLPRWRGAAPIQRAILAGDAVTGVSIMRMEAGLDTGPVYATRTLSIAPEDTAGTLQDRLALLGAALLIEVLTRLPGLEPKAQNPALATYAAKLTRAEARLDWTRPAAELERAVRAFNPWPMAWTLYKGEPLRILRAQALVPAPGAVAPGTVLAAGEEGVEVAAGVGRLRVLELQAAGGRAMPAVDFSRGRALVGLRLEG
ncbi:MAG: methionyl-tRNA formyltransferase [Gammaproteobacteria bacterium]